MTKLLSVNACPPLVDAPEADDAAAPALDAAAGALDAAEDPAVAPFAAADDGALALDATDDGALALDATGEGALALDAARELDDEPEAPDELQPARAIAPIATAPTTPTNDLRTRVTLLFSVGIRQRRDPLQR